MPKRKRRRAQESDALHDQHSHHTGNAPPIGELPASRFPREEYEEGEVGIDELEVRGFLGFVHARCPFSNPRACQCGRYSCHIDSIVVAIDGACPNNGNGAVKSACGVYFGSAQPEMQQNLSWPVRCKPGYSHTSQRAKLLAALGALRAVKRYVESGGQWDCEPDTCETPCPVRHVIIKSDSAYLVNSITYSIKKWLSNGWLTANKTPVKNQDLWEEMVDRIRDINDLGAAVDFWLVPRDRNSEADRLANLALET